MNQADISKIVDDNMKARRSIRAFLPTEIPEAVILDLLDVAARAPSWMYVPAVVVSSQKYGLVGVNEYL
mgnify:CR=1 FL=1